MAEVMQFFDAITTEIVDLRHQVRTLAARREGLDPEQLAVIVANRLAPQLDAARRARRLAVRRATK